MIFLESPWPILLIGIAAEAILVVILLRTGQGRALWAMLGMGLIVLTGVVLERLVVTDREAVTGTLNACAAAAQANDINRLLRYVSPSAKETQAFARTVLDRVEIHKAKLNDLEITFNRQASPPAANAKFLAIGAGRDRKGEFPYENLAQPLSVSLRREGDHWLVVDCKVEELRKP